MQILSEAEIIARISVGDSFSAQVDSGSFNIKIDHYEPIIGTAIHSGHRVVSPFSENLLVSENERRFEEDPFTGDFISSLPITLQVVDSRYFYDLNRHPQECIYDEAWGKRVWKRNLVSAEVRVIQEHHQRYYRILGHLMSELEKRFLRCIVYDVHSYNYARIAGRPPLFNIGTHYINRPLYKPILEALRSSLSAVELNGVESRCVFDGVFTGKGYQAAYLSEHHPDSLCIPLEIKKIFMNEQNFTCSKDIFSDLKGQLDQALKKSAELFRDYSLKMKKQ